MVGGAPGVVAINRFRINRLLGSVHSLRFSEAKNPVKGKVLNIQNLPYFWNTKTHVVFFVFHFEQKKISLMNALVYVDIDQGIH